MEVRRRARSRGVTLVEVLIVLAVVTAISAMTMFGTGVAEGARLRRSSVLIASAIRLAYAHANASSRTVRLVFDFNKRTISVEQMSGRLALAKSDHTGGAAAATEAERKATEEADQILKGPRPPRPAFTPLPGFGGTKGSTGRELERNIRFLQIETGHDDQVVKADRAYLYFWPGGQTERAAIQLSVGGSTLDTDVSTVVVSPLTGKADIKKGRVAMPRPRNDYEESERGDTGF